MTLAFGNEPSNNYWSNDDRADGRRGLDRGTLRDGADPLADAIDEVARTGEWRCEPLRSAVVRFAREAHDQALQLDETVRALRFRLRGLLDRLTADARGELMTCVQWWAAHGYFRAD